MKPSMSQVREPPFLPSPKGGGFRAAISVMRRYERACVACVQEGDHAG